MDSPGVRILDQVPLLWLSLGPRLSDGDVINHRVRNKVIGHQQWEPETTPRTRLTRSHLSFTIENRHDFGGMSDFQLTRPAMENSLCLIVGDRIKQQYIPQ